MKDPVAEFIRLLRETNPRWFRKTFTNGACYRLFEILHHLWPEAECWVARWSDGWFVQCHVYTLIGKRFYDIFGWHHEATIVRAVNRKLEGEFTKLRDGEEDSLRRMLPRYLEAEV